MTAPTERKTIQVSPEIHARVHHLCTVHGQSANDVIGSLINMSTTVPRVPLNLSDDQLMRWSAYAEAAGMSVADWVIARVEAAIQYGTDPGTMHAILCHVRTISEAMGLEVPRPAARRPPAPSPFAEPTERSAT